MISLFGCGIYYQAMHFRGIKYSGWPKKAFYTGLGSGPWTRPIQIVTEAQPKPAQSSTPIMIQQSHR
uniref:Uncharacterized protein n=1 Tax=Nelumbo nucifera TaxID=4432 RepID=A0A822Z3H6_NELNU|nr:TPA_asm: hypothetical protein HUJ06_013905 [Nelumbo nucifera]